MEILASIFGGGGLGAIVGAVASIWKGSQESKERANERDHQFKMAKLNLDERQLEQSHEIQMADKQIERAETEGRVAIDIAETGAFRESLAAGIKSTGIKIVDAIRGLMRPIITVYMLGLATWVSIDIAIAVDGLDALHNDELLTIYKQIIGDLMFLTMTAVTWWFGSRPSRKL